MLPFSRESYRKIGAETNNGNDFRKGDIYEKDETNDSENAHESERRTWFGSSRYR